MDFLTDIKQERNKRAHPPINERIKILRSISNGANFINYQSAFSKIKGKKNIIPPSGRHEGSQIPLRQGSVVSNTKSAKKSTRSLGDLMRAVNKYAFLTCACGLKMKIPPDYKKNKVICPRCGRKNKIPVAELTAMSGMITGMKQKDKQHEIQPDKDNSFVYHRTGKGWESFNCRCGSPKQLSPAFNKPYFICNKCGRKIIVK